MDSSEETVRVNLGPRSYDIRIGSGVLAALGPALAAMRARTAVIISDDNVAPLYADAAMASLKKSGVSAGLIDFPHGEANKNLATVAAIFDRLFAIDPPIDRDTFIVALGGGVTGDIAGFVAATALRGLRWAQCSTTLLADVDASVGGKTGVDHPAGKNLIGAFHQPRVVLIDVDTLKTLPPHELRNGLAECVKHGVIRDESLLALLESRAGAVLACDGATMVELLTRNVEIKAAVVSADEREAGVRAHLNFGHTIGHAIETLLGYGGIGHGQAISLGMVAACRMALRRGLIDEGYALRIEGLLGALGLPVNINALQARGVLGPDAVLRTMQHDKKARAGGIRMVLPTGPGRVEIFADIDQSSIRDALGYLGI
ncbi:MAG: 3-dehydroquinate synthase [Phycisphaerae bacterium]